ncbi:hypothetical protein RN001_014685 [Aquatica leii]|uniref:N-acetyltransferase domain-containing protein n=1 Tax=Aquatica leii TaxID=1421715 RepID=A0AAN7S6B1_9COLE|nr:hypothetical protein RN001_014685 [Aquatica leii]
MLINKSTKIIGQDVILVPYRKEHVQKYHKWMQSEEIQHLTASEPLTIEQEYEMQQSWMIDENKCTFIVLDRHIFEKNHNEVEAMIGDTNLFFANEENRIVAEAEIMIAEEGSRGQRRGWQAMLLMLLYGIANLGVQQYVVKITCDNDVSINMFKKMGFEEVSRNRVFNEITLIKLIDSTWNYWLKNSVGEFKLINENDVS